MLVLERTLNKLTACVFCVLVMKIVKTKDDIYSVTESRIRSRVLSCTQPRRSYFSW